MSFSAVSPTNSLQPYRAPVFDAATFQAMIDAAPENPARAQRGMPQRCRWRRAGQSLD